MRGYPQFSFWILIALAKICFFHIVLRTFARKTSTVQIFSILCNWLQSDNELPMSEMEKNWGGHRLRFRNKARQKLPQF